MLGGTVARRVANAIDRHPGRWVRSARWLSRSPDSPITLLRPRGPGQPVRLRQPWFGAAAPSGFDAAAPNPTGAVTIIQIVNEPAGRRNQSLLLSCPGLRLVTHFDPVLRSWVPLDIPLGHHRRPDPGAHSHVQHPELRRARPLLL